MSIRSTFIFIFVMPMLVMAMEGPDSRFDYQEVMQAARAFQAQNLSQDKLEHYTKEMQRVSGLDQAGMLLPSCLMQSKLTEKDLQIFFDCILLNGSCVRPELLKALQSKKNNNVWDVAAGHIPDCQLDEDDAIYGGPVLKVIKHFIQDPRSYDQKCIDNHWLVFGAQVLFWDCGGKDLVWDQVLQNDDVTEKFLTSAETMITDIQRRIADNKAMAQNVVSIVNTMLNSPGAQIDVAGWVHNVIALNDALHKVREVVQSIRHDMKQLGF